MADIIRVIAEGSLDGEAMLTSFAWSVADAELADFDDLVNEFYDIFDTNLITSMVIGAEFSSALVNVWPAVVGAPLTPALRILRAPLGGEAGGDFLPQGTSLLLNFKCLELPPNRKRMYIGGWSESVNTTNGFPATAIKNQAQAMIDALLTPLTINSKTFAPCVLRLGENGEYLAHNTLTHGFVSDNWARLSSRRSR